jgi:replication factor C small subunit
MTPWEIKYRPLKLEDYVFQDKKQEEIIKKIIKEKNIPHLLLQGHRGTGKTSLAFLIKNELNIEDFDFLKLNASDENSVDIMRTKIKNFVSTAVFGDSGFKIVFLDEADYLTDASQAILRNMMEEYAESVRFILTCNKPHKIIPELKSRCLEIVFKSLDKETMLEKFVYILKKEKIKIPDPEILLEHLEQAYPDFRKLLVTAQASIKDNHIQRPSEISDSLEDKVQIIELINEGKWEEARHLVCSSISDDGYEEMYRFLYDHLHELDVFTNNTNWKKGILVISDHLYRSAFVADQEINFVACMIKLSEIK